MAKHSFEKNRQTPALRPILLAALAVGLVASSVCADQQAPKAPSPKSAPAPASAPKKTSTKKSSALPTTPAVMSIVKHKSKTSSTQRAATSDGRRDPFKIPVFPTGKGNGEGVANSAPGGNLPPGVRGLLISQLRLEGVVRQQVSNKMIAVVANETNRAYFLTENESVYNGVVSKITPDAVYFKENVLDGNGRVTTHEVMKRLGSAPGEAR